eukprot:10653965-Heterocapsa_arctica.AAC.2
MGTLTGLACRAVSDGDVDWACLQERSPMGTLTGRRTTRLRLGFKVLPGPRSKTAKLAAEIADGRIGLEVDHREGCAI